MKQKIRSVLDGYKLRYEEMEFKHVSKTTPKPKVSKTTSKTTAKPTSKSLRERVSDKLQPVRVKFNNMVKKLKQPRKKSKKTTKAERLEARKQKLRGIIGIGLLLTVVSIVYSTYMVNLFVDGTEMVVALAPQVIAASIITIYAFYKIYK